MDEKRKSKWLRNLILLSAFAYLTYDIFIVTILGFLICSSNGYVDTYVNKKVTHPLSIIYLDNIDGGFDEDDRLLIIMNYLDGVHLQEVAINGDDGNLYKYTAKKSDWESSDSKRALGAKGYNMKSLRKDALKIFKNGIEVGTEELSKFNYLVEYNAIPLPFLDSKYIRQDEVKIVQLNTGETLGYNRRVLRKFYRILPDFVGGRLYFPKPICGNYKLYKFDEEIFHKATRKFFNAKRREGLIN